MSKALFISAYLPLKSVPAAGNKLSYEKLEQLRHECASVDVITFANNHEAATLCGEYPYSSFYVFPIDIQARLTAAAAHPILPMGASVRAHLARRRTRDLLVTHDYNMIFVDFLQAAAILPANKRDKAELRVHDVMSQMYRRQMDRGGAASALAFVEWCRSLHYESNVLSGFSKVSFLSEKDRNLLCRHLDSSTATVVEMPVAANMLGSGRARLPQRGQMLFFANYARFENADAALYFVRDILPMIHAERPEAYVVLAGANPPDDIRALEGPSVKVTGFLDDPSNVFATSQIAVAPLRYGAGVKIKVLEALATGLPTVATPIGAEGIAPDKLLSVAGNAAAFARECIRLIGESQ
jgi:glycosyltransferase involved in cell wall biosynthesis